MSYMRNKEKIKMSNNDLVQLNDSISNEFEYVQNFIEYIVILLKTFKPEKLGDK